MLPVLPDEVDDAFGELERVVARKAANEQALQKISASRCGLILGKGPNGQLRDSRAIFFATLALRLKTVEDWTIDTMATEGKSLFYNPEFVNKLLPEELTGVIIHEVMHCAMAHHCRRGNRNHKKWNIACDLAINSIISGAGFKLPASRLEPGKGSYASFPKDLSSEHYYTMLPPEPPDGGDDPGGCGEVRDAGSPADNSNQESDWRAAVAQAEQTAKTRGQGSLPAGLSRSVNEVLRPPADWKAVLREFVTSHSRNDYSWVRPNRRFIAQGLYLPGLHSEELGDVVIAVDTSGSVGPAELAAFACEVNGVLGAFDCTATVLFHDTEIQNEQHWRSSDGPLVLEPAGGGGTSHVCVFEKIAEAAITPSCVICLTDLYTDFPADPGLPVLWAVVGGNVAMPPFGRVVQIDN